MEGCGLVYRCRRMLGYRHVQEVRTQMVVRFRDRRLWLEVHMQKNVMVQARTGGRDADGCEVQG